MCKGTKVTIFAYAGSTRVTLTKLCLVHLWMVKLFDVIMCVRTLVAFLANLFLFLGFEYLWAQFTAVGAEFAPAILMLIMILGALLHIMVI